MSSKRTIDFNYSNELRGLDLNCTTGISFCVLDGSAPEKILTQFHGRINRLFEELLSFMLSIAGGSESRSSRESKHAVA